MIKPSLLIALFLLPGFASAGDYSSGHQALQVWDADAQANMPQWIKYWLLFMVSVFALGLCFVWHRVEARWLVGGFSRVYCLANLLCPPWDGYPYQGWSH